MRWRLGACDCSDDYQRQCPYEDERDTIWNLTTQKSILFVPFGGEEKGLIGSKAMVNANPRDEIPKYCAMINIDSFGLAAPFALEGSLSKKLMTLAEEVSNQMRLSFERIRINGADSDSSSFIAKKIPAVTLSGLSNEWHSILHTTLVWPRE